jgi:hypothetical protein
VRINADTNITGSNAETYLSSTKSNLSSLS